MAFFDVTVSRTGCVIVEADTAEEAELIAANCEENQVAWTDEWSADSAEKIADNPDEMGEDAKLAVSDPYIKARIVAKQCGFFCCLSTDGRLHASPFTHGNDNSLIALKERLEGLNYTVDVIGSVFQSLLIGLPGTTIWKVEE